MDTHGLREILDNLRDHPALDPSVKQQVSVLVRLHDGDSVEMPLRGLYAIDHDEVVLELRGVVPSRRERASGSTMTAGDLKEFADVIAGIDPDRRVMFVLKTDDGDSYYRRDIRIGALDDDAVTVEVTG